MDLKQISNELQVVRSYVRKLFLIEGLLRSFAVLAAGLISLFLMDYFLRLPAPVRVILELGFAAYFVKILYLHLYYPLSRKISEDDIAIVVERKFPQLKERLISTLQLNRSLQQQDSSGVQPHAAMVQALSQETFAAIRDINFREAIFPENLKKVLAIAAGVFLVMAMYGGAYPENTGIFVKRLLGSNVTYPPKTFVRLESPIDLVDADGPATMVIGYGSEIDIRVRVTGKPRKRVTMFRRQDARSNSADAIWEPFQMEQDPEDETLYRLMNPKSILSFDFRIVAGDGYLPGPSHNDYHTITVDYPPRIVNNSIEIEYDYPAYTKMKSRTDRNRMIKAPVGTTITYRAEADIQITNAYLRLYSTEDETKDVANIPMIVTQGNRIEGRFEVKQTLKYELFLEKVVGDSTLSNRHDPVRGGIAAIIDEAPIVNLRYPKSNSNITPQGYIPFHLLAKDDYGISDIIILSKVKPGGSLERIEQTPYHLVHTLPNPDDEDAPLPGDTDLPYGEKKITGKTKFHLKPLNLKVGDFITVQVEASDNREGDSNYGRSREFTFTLVDEEVIREEIAKRLADLIRRLDAARTEQVDVRKRTYIVYDALKSKNRTVNTQEKIAVTHAKSKQHRLTTEFTDAKGGFDAIIDLYFMNGIVDSEQVKIEGFAREMETLAGKLSPQARNRITESGSLSTAPEQIQTLANAITTQDEIITRLDNVLEELNKYADYNDIIRYTRQLLKIQKAILEDTRKAAHDKIKED